MPEALSGEPAGRALITILRFAASLSMEDIKKILSNCQSLKKGKTIRNNMKLVLR
jgi:hypothetical protein